MKYKCRDCKWLSDEYTSSGNVCKAPKKWLTDTACCKLPSQPACKRYFELKGGGRKTISFNRAVDLLQRIADEQYKINHDLERREALLMAMEAMMGGKYDD